MAKAPQRSRPIAMLIPVVIMIAAMGLTVFSIVDSNRRAAGDRAAQSLLNQMQSKVYDLTILTQQAASGDRDALASLPDMKTQILRLQTQFTAATDELAAAPKALLQSQVQAIATNIDLIEAQTENVNFLYAQLAILGNRIPQVQQAYTNVVDSMLSAGSPAQQVATAQEQVFRAERLLTSLNRVLFDADNAVAAAEQFRQDVLVFNQVLAGMQDGNVLMGLAAVRSPDARQALEGVQAQFAELDDAIESVIGASSSLTDIAAAAEIILANAAALLQSTASLSDAIGALANDWQARPLATPFTTLGSAGMVVLMLLFLGVQAYTGARRNLTVTEAANERNQQAILRLLDEIAALGDGDLRVQATVTEDFTGAIADAINFAIEQLRELVARMASTADAVAASSNETRARSLRLSEASEHQSSQIVAAASSINQISQNLGQVSANAQKLANNAQNSVQVAREGAAVVQDTIEGMNGIREQIQDTQKRIKRLGESSQEIGNIVSLINELADQTNILALNASIQAAMAGEAGRGFAVVADEVQGLAEQAASSTGQIENLVKTIQSDTDEANSSMEKTTAEVVRGARLANNAGTALTDIQSTSESLATLISQISSETQTQSQSAERIAGSMRVIQDISTQVLEGTTQSAQAVGELSEQADELRESVANFRLPTTPPPGASTAGTPPDSATTKATAIQDDPASADDPVLALADDDLLDIDLDEGDAQK
ncbi:MAG: methyl-accepting chemotaxis protein [Cellvibrionales bacterium]|nr:methyl-accepting chemotaxis protein [Cellvibrionales bacterium]